MKCSLLDKSKFESYYTESNDLCIHDLQEKLVIIRESLDGNRYNLILIIEDDSYHYPNVSFPPNPCGIYVREEMTFNEWVKLVRKYIKKRLQGEKVLRGWLMEEVGSDLEMMSDECEAPPYDAPIHEWKLHHEFMKRKYGL